MDDVLSSGPTPAGAPGPEAPAPSADHAPAGDPSPTSGPVSAPPDEPTPARPSSRFKDLQEAESRYVGLQRELEKHVRAVAELGDLSQLKEREAFVDHLIQDPKFLEWAQQRVAEEQAGASDPQTMRALEIVNAVAEARVQEALAPLQAQATQQKIDHTFAQMDHIHGAEWKQYQPHMRTILQEGIKAGHFAPDVETNFDLRFVNALYNMARANDPNYWASQHEKRVKTKQSNATTASPGTAPNALGSGRASSIEEAAAMAMKQLGMR